MTKEQLFNLFQIEDLRDLPDVVMKVLEGDLEKRDGVYRKLLEINNYDLSYDWFQGSYESELAERGQKKQDFTPNQVGRLASLLTGNPKGKIYEPTAGNGSMIIADWWTRRTQYIFAFNYKPSEHMIQCCELSVRSIPILLLNLSIRGIMGYVYHGDVLEQKFKCKYILLNRNDDALSFSEIIKDPENNKWITDVTQKGEEIVYKTGKYF